MRPRSSLLMLAAALLLSQSAALASSHDTGNYPTYDYVGDYFYADQVISYYGISGGVHTDYSELYVNVFIGSLGCGYGAVERSGGTRQVYQSWSPFPLTVSNTPIWWVLNWNENDSWVGGIPGYVSWYSYAWDGNADGCNGFNKWKAGGWKSTLSSSGAWQVFHQTH